MFLAVIEIMDNKIGGIAVIIVIKQPPNRAPACVTRLRLGYEQKISFCRVGLGQKIGARIMEQVEQGAGQGRVHDRAGRGRAGRKSR